LIVAWNHALAIVLASALATMAPPALVPQQPSAQQPAAASDSDEVNTGLMLSTFEIEGTNSIGSGFVLGRPLADGKTYRLVLVTAAHVLRDMKGDTVVVHFRHKVEGKWQALPKPLKIRSGLVPLWKEHPSADVAAIYIEVPRDVFPNGVISMTTLADDEKIKKFGIHPGDEVMCLGFPVGERVGSGGFPILRSGRIASFPLLPSKTLGTFLLDFAVFPGNSGGPAYFLYAGVRGKLVVFGSELVIMGVVSREQMIANRVALNLAEIVHASLIRETIELLPLPK
jgi:S1-C subfamily serine protease